MFTDPVTINWGGTNRSLPRISSGENGSQYKWVGDDSNILLLNLNHQLGTGKGRDRTVARLERTGLSVNPLNPDDNVPVQMAVTLSLDAPANLSSTEIAQLAISLVVFLAGSGSDYSPLIRLSKGET